MLLDVLDDVFLLDLPLEPSESAFNRLALLYLDFSHATNTPFAGGNWCKYARLSQQARILGAFPVKVNEITSRAHGVRAALRLAITCTPNESSRSRKRGARARPRHAPRRRP